MSTALSNSEDEVEIWIESKPQPARKVSERKREDVALFQSWLINNPAADKKQTQARDDQEMTTGWLVKQGQREEIISSPREYQLELFEIAKERNTIIVLDTGRSYIRTGRPLFFLLQC
jgi:endoribonuclease Dicer